MKNLEEIQEALLNLAPEELAAFRVWFSDYDWHSWDREFERDVAAGNGTH